MAGDETRLHSLNPLFMKYEPTEGEFAGQHGYGYRGIEAFIDAVQAITEGRARPEDFDAALPTAASALQGTAILEAGRKSLDDGGIPVALVVISKRRVFRVMMSKGK
uniref:D-galacturonate reductase n=1 Tax=Candidatus Kentrum sp. TC TaxID=2126339 RepID=A0A451A794_9GAMM|nr:MAG: D-galacturonate reductase [Candidatus Kentron sp. TC]VFK61903.1 MAG: D-galacturonate reductase [Candidatus Kentron sp. TC]